MVSGGAEQARSRRTGAEEGGELEKGHTCDPSGAEWKGVGIEAMIDIPESGDAFPCLDLPRQGAAGVWAICHLHDFCHP